jgi:glycosyltransferase involved in cell wall biosynthesis
VVPQGVDVPRFSIVVPAYNAEVTLAETLEAVLAQTFGDWECVVVDDGSTDDTLRIASAYATRDPRIRVLHQENQGTAGAYNTGVSAATGDFVVICSADDILLPEHLSRMSAFIDREDGYDIYTSNGYRWWPGDSRDICYGPGQSERVHSLQLADVIRRCFLGVGAVYRREMFAAVGGYRQGVFAEDYDLWLRAMASGARHRYLPEPLFLHRVSPTQKSANPEASLRSIIQVATELRRDYPLSADESQAVDEIVLEAEHWIAELNRPWGLYRNVLRPAVLRVVVRLLGRRRARRLSGALKSMAGRGART